MAVERTGSEQCLGEVRKPSEWVFDNNNFSLKPDVYPYHVLASEAEGILKSAVDGISDTFVEVENGWQSKDVLMNDTSIVVVYENPKINFSSYQAYTNIIDFIKYWGRFEWDGWEDSDESSLVHPEIYANLFKGTNLYPDEISVGFNRYSYLERRQSIPVLPSRKVKESKTQPGVAYIRVDLMDINDGIQSAEQSLVRAAEDFAYTAIPIFETKRSLEKAREPNPIPLFQASEK